MRRDFATLVILGSAVLWALALAVALALVCTLDGCVCFARVPHSPCWIEE